VNSLTARRRHPLAALVVLVFALGVTGALYAVLTASPKAHADSGQTASPQQIDLGKRLYISSCSSCHGLNGGGESGRGPSLLGVGPAAVDFQVGTGRMPAQQVGPQVERKANSFTQDQIDAMAAYVNSLAPGGPQVPSQAEYDPDAPSLLDPSGNQVSVPEGGVLFRTNCSSCHNFAGQGGALTDGKFAPSLQGTTAKHIYEAMLTGPQNMPQFPDSIMPPAQKQAIIRYLTSARVEPSYGGNSLGRIGPVSEGAALFVFGITILIGLCTWIGARTTKASRAKIAAYHAAMKDRDGKADH
jgi:ubiquinol-cytochrome c reductase cytochrome c subunit